VTVARDFWPPIFFSHESTPNGFLIHTLNLGFHIPLNIFLRLEISCYCPSKPLKSKKHLVAKKYIVSCYSTAENMSKIAEMKLSSCGLEVADFRKICDWGIAELRLRINIALKSCGIAIAEVLPSSCGIAIADSKKSCA
jgi:hypothetical protein